MDNEQCVACAYYADLDNLGPAFCQRNTGINHIEKSIDAEASSGENCEPGFSFRDELRSPLSTAAGIVARMYLLCPDSANAFASGEHDLLVEKLKVNDTADPCPKPWVKKFFEIHDLLKNGTGDQE